MSLSPGVRLGPYEVVAPAGAGGMGEVYRARDTRLDRTVAIKVLPVALAADPQLRERFEREARAISSLQHPHICALFDVGRDGDHDFLVLEYLEGETIADRLARTGAIGVAEALRIAAEVCDALDRAHRSGIVHRDLKPANVMLTKAGAKLLDFGLAKAAAPVVGASGHSMLPTTPANVTAQGTILGTFQYMAPEQIEGLEADARTDIFAFGALVFEMLTGHPPFAGKTRASLLGAILKDEPPRVSKLTPTAPPALDRIVATCLEKDPDDRYQSARDLLRDLKWIAAGGGIAAAPVAEARRVRHLTPIGWAIVVLLSLAMAIGGMVVSQRRLAPAGEPIQFTIAPPPSATFAALPGGGTGIATQLALSPDGRNVVFVANRDGGYQLWLRALSAGEPRQLTNTDGAIFPFWSPDSQFIAFFADGKLKKIPIAGGPSTVLCDAPAGRGGAWNRDNIIVFSPSPAATLQRVSAAGGIPQPASQLDRSYGETSHRFPSFLPDGRHFFYTAAVGTCCPPSKPAVVRIGVLDSLDAETVLQAESSVQLTAGHVLFGRQPEGTLMAQPFDAATRRLSGEPFPVAQHIGWEGSRYNSFAASPAGTLVYGGGTGRTTGQLTWLDRSGRTTGTLGEPQAYASMTLSADERRVAVTAMTGTPENREIWLLDVDGASQRRLTFDPGDDLAAIWAPDDSYVMFQGSRSGQTSLRRQRLDQTGTDEEVFRGGAIATNLPTDISRDGKFALLQRAPGTEGSPDVWGLALQGDRKAFPLVETAGADTNGVFAPDRRWFAYQSNENGVSQIYVQPFPPTGPKFQVSSSGGVEPLWSSNGKELFFVSLDGNLMVAAIDTSESFRSGAPAQMFTLNASTGRNVGSIGHQYAVSRDGRRFLVISVQQQASSLPITAIVNWASTLQK